MDQRKKKLGLALSGAAARSVFYIGFLEVLTENNIEIDYISANSGSCVVASAFACGTLDELKRQVFDLNKEFLYSIVQRSKVKGGIYSMEKVEEELRKYTKDLRFEDVKPAMGFVCVNINNGEEVILSMGEIAKAICASSAIPGIFKPMRWGRWDLVDGGLLNPIPGRAAKEAGCEVVVGLYVASREYVFSGFEIGIKKIADFVYRILAIDTAKRAFNSALRVLEKNSYFGYFLDFEESNQQLHVPGMFEVLGKAIDIAVQAEKNNQTDPNFGCDFVIKPPLAYVPIWKRIFYLWFADLNGTQALYEQGRATAEKNLPKIKQLIGQND